MNDDILVKYLLGEATAEEQQLVQEWTAADENNRRYFEHFKLIWEQSKKLAVKSTVNEDEAWQRFKQRTETHVQKSRTIEMPSRNFSWARAASILLVIAVGGMLMYFITRNSSPHMITLRSGNATLTDTLPDGSVVTLNKDAELSYPEDFDGDMRQIALNGEAFFDVAPDKDKPFVISVNEVTVQVVGTSFNVKGTSEKTEVIVETGIVAVKKNTNEVKLAPNEKATVLKSAAAPVKEDVEDALYNYYRTKEFVCNGTPLWRLADVLGDAYSVNIVIATERAKNLELTTTFKNESLENILSVVSETLNVRIERKGVDYIIK